MRLREGWGTLDGGRMKMEYKGGPPALRIKATLSMTPGMGSPE
jgi:hypothetical protein